MRVSSSAPAMLMPDLLDRQQIEDEIDRLIAILDAMDPDPDLEPSLGWSPYVDDPRTVDIEGDDCDLEPSLGAPEVSMAGAGISQINWGAGPRDDLEEECDDEGDTSDDDRDYRDNPADHGYPGPLFGASIGYDPSHNPHKIPSRDIRDDLLAVTP